MRADSWDVVRGNFFMQRIAAISDEGCSWSDGRGMFFTLSLIHDMEDFLAVYKILHLGNLVVINDCS